MQSQMEGATNRFLSGWPVLNLSEIQMWNTLVLLHLSRRTDDDVQYPLSLTKAVLFNLNSRLWSVVSSQALVGLPLLFQSRWVLEDVLALELCLQRPVSHK
jgi:hypothetical protein